jgi:protein phosphatase methylesterase 1
MISFRIGSSSKVPVPIKMYTKPVNVGSPHHFTMPGTHSQKASFDPLPWSDFFDRKEKIHDRVPVYIAGDRGHVFLCLHGAGNSALSFAALAKKMKGESTVVAFDFRGHGDHTSENDGDLNWETLVDDTIEVVKYLHSVYPERSIILVGHSMGGSIATKAAYKIQSDAAFAEDPIQK